MTTATFPYLNSYPCVLRQRMHCDVKIFYGSLLYEKIGADFTV